MIIKSYKNLDNNQIEEIRSVELVCRGYDNLTGELYLDGSMNFNQDINTVYLAYKDNILVSLLTMFIPTCHEAEISAFTLPEYRMKGYFKKLLKEAVEELKRYEIPQILLVCQTSSKFGREAVRKAGGEYAFTEYSLKYKNISSIYTLNSRLKLYKPVLEDVEKLTCVSQLAFNENYEDARVYILKSLNVQGREQYAAVLEGQIIGIGSVSYEQHGAGIYGFAILPEFQGKGFGKEFLGLIVNMLLERGIIDISIEVDSSNVNAYQLYLKSGFEVETAFDYYKKEI